MTFHASSLADYSRRLSRVSECLLSGAPLEHSAALIRAQLEARVVAVRIGGRHAGAGLLKVFDFSRGDVPAVHADDDRLAALEDESHVRAAVSTGDAEGTRCSLSVFRSREDDDFTSEDEALCEIFAAQLRRGLELSARISDNEVERALYAQVLDRLSVGVITLDGAGRVLKCSAGAEGTLARRDGLLIQAGRLRAASCREDALLQAAIRAAAEGPDAGEARAVKGLSVSRATGDRGLGIVVQSIAREGRAPGCAARVAVYLRDPDCLAEVEGDLIRQLFDLTPAEAAVARRLASGLSLEEAASALDISRNTARAHLRSIFSKSGITRQTELVRLMLTSAAVLGPGQRRVA